MNMLGLAYFHTGDYEAALATFQRNLARGGPIGPHMLVYIAATHAAMGNTEEEREILRWLKGNRSHLWVAGWLARVFRNPKDTEKLRAILDKVK